MGLFKKGKKDRLDEKTDLELSFEEKGQKIGKETGEFVQKSINKVNKMKKNYDTVSKIGKVRGFAGKAEQRVEKLVEKADQKRKDVVEKVKKK